MLLPIVQSHSCVSTNAQTMHKSGASAVSPQVLHSLSENDNSALDEITGSAVSAEDN